VINFRLQRYALLALASAALFGASAPLAKRLLDSVSPLQLAGLLYLGSGVALAALWLGLRLAGVRSEATLERRDFGWLAAATVCGGVVAPWLLLTGLRGMPASSASLLLNLEGVLTVIVAALAFREAVGRRVWVGALVMLAGASVLSWSPGTTLGVSTPALFIVAACLFWALDNNFTRPISGADPIAIACIKGLAAGSVNLLLAVAAGDSLPGGASAISALVVGAAGYGVSLVLYVTALRHLGAARTAAHFGTAPFIGAVLAVPLLGEPIDWRLATGFAFMLAATWILLREFHGHEHLHVPQEHAHRHVHDEHHHHEHRGDEGPEPHTHPHQHEPLRHTHPHCPDLHHRHHH
jgi:drug/metabolite transporter (DMT)-like permease